MSNYSDIDMLSDHLQHSPTTIHMHQLDMIERAVNGEIDIIDPNSPFIQLLELGATHTAACLQKTDSVTRKRYPRLAQTMSELFSHMSDADFAGIHASPIRNHIVTIGLGTAQILQYAMTDNLTGLRHIEIPRDTVLTASDISFTFHQPIRITVYPNNEIRAQFNGAVESPILERKANTIETRYGYVDTTKFFILDIPCDQLNVVSQEQAVTSSQSWTIEATYDNQFYYARGYYTVDGVSWIEMHTTHDADTYDPINPTMVVEVTEGILKAHIPDVFINKNQVGIKARVDIYTTFGATEINLGAVESGDWDGSWNDFSGLSGDYIEPLQDITSRVIFSTQVSNGGSDGLSFEEIRERVVYNKYGKKGAYTEEELKQELADLGYLSSLRKDTLTDRIYVASRSVGREDLLSVAGLVSGAGVVNEPVEVFTGRADATYGMVVNAERTVLKPSMVYTETAGGMTIVPDADYTELTTISKARLVDKLNSELHFYTPFHTVLDYSTPVFKSRAYWMTSPREAYRNAIGVNTALGFAIETSSVDITLDGDKYLIVVNSSRPKGVTGFKLQLTFEDESGSVVYLTADETIVSDTELKFSFELPTTFDLTSKHLLDTKALDSNGILKDTRIHLEQIVNLVYLVTTNVAQPTAYDDKAYLNAYGDVRSVVALEESSLCFGNYLDGLYVESRTLLQTPVYETYLTDVPAVYAEDIYQTDLNGRVMNVEDDGSISFTKLFSAGEQKEVNGELQWEHRAGETKLNPITGDPIVLEAATYRREVRLPLFDARFLFAETEALKVYREAIPVQINDFLTRDISTLKDSVFERTELYFEPLATQQSTVVKISDERQTIMRTALSFTVNYHVTVPAYEDSAFRTTLEAATKKAIVEELKGNQFSQSSLIARLNVLAPGKVINVTINNPVGSTGVAEILEALSSFSIDKSMRLQSNGQISISDDIDVSFTK